MDEISPASGVSMNRFCVAVPECGTEARTAAQQQRARGRAAIWLLALSIAALGTTGLVAAANHRHTPTQARKADKAEHSKNRSVREAGSHSAGKAKKGKS